MLRHIIKVSVLVLSLYGLSGCAALSPSEPSACIRLDHPVKQVRLSNIENDTMTILNLRLLETPEQQAQGLMNCERLPEDGGVLMVLTAPRSLGIWMKNMRIPIDVMYFDASGLLIGLVQRFEPCKSDQACPIVAFDKVKYVVETTAGFAHTHALRPFKTQMRVE